MKQTSRVAQSQGNVRQLREARTLSLGLLEDLHLPEAIGEDDSQRPHGPLSLAQECFEGPVLTLG